MVPRLQLPIELGRCQYEKGSDGQMLTYLTSPDMVSARLLDSDWDATSVLDAVALADPPFNALIDTGALVTGMSNLEGMVAPASHQLDHCNKLAGCVHATHSATSSNGRNNH